MSDEELKANGNIKLMPTGVLLSIRHPERGSYPEWTQEAVFTSAEELVDAIYGLWDDYVLDKK